MGSLGTTELLLVLVVLVALFGAKRLPGAARSLGQSMRIFKAETKGLRADDGASDPTPPSLEAATPVAQPAPASAEPQSAEHRS